VTVSRQAPAGGRREQRRSERGSVTIWFGRGVVTVVPVTSRVDRVYPFQVLPAPAATGLAVASKAQAEQVRSVDVGRVGERIGVMSPSLMSALDEALRLHLAL
jgi:mRNA interferase MazF